MIRLLTLCMVLIRTMTFAQETAVDSFREVARKLPAASTFASSKRPYTITKGAFDVKRSTSLVTSVVGELDFTATFEAPGGAETKLSLRLEFAYTGGKWEFVRLRNTASRKDITSLPLGRDMLESGELQRFLSELTPVPTPSQPRK